MSVAGRITTGFVLIMALMMGLLAYDLSLVRRLAVANQNLSEINLQTTTSAIEIERMLNQQGEFINKYFVRLDTDYVDRVEELHGRVAEVLERISAYELTEPEREWLDRLVESWTEYSGLVETLRTFPETEDVDPEEYQTVARDSLVQLGTQVKGLIDTTQAIVEEEVAASTQASEQARNVSWTFVAAALGLSVPVLWLTIRSIREPLKRLTEGTRAVADGEFVYQLDASRRDEFSRLAASFNEMVTRLRILDEVKQDLLSHVSHELRTPLVAMLETNSLLLEEIPGALNEKQRRMLSLNQQSGQRLSAMISKLLDVARIEAQTLEYDFKSQDLVDLVRTAVAGFEARARERSVGLGFASDVEEIEVRCDRDRIIQVVDNLLENAVKFSPSGASVWVRLASSANADTMALASWVQSGRDRDGHVLVEVVDSGPGVPDGHKRWIFEKFHRVTGRAEGDGSGVGLGLAISKEIVDAHRGAIWVRDNLEGGSIFAFMVPAVAGQGSPAGKGSG